MHIRHGKEKKVITMIPSIDLPLLVRCELKKRTKERETVWCLPTDYRVKRLDIEGELQNPQGINSRI